MDFNGFNRIYKELAELIGIENAVKLNAIYGGQQRSFPKRIVSQDYCEKQIKQEYNGKNVKELAQKYGYTERWVYKILKK